MQACKPGSVSPQEKNLIIYLGRFSRSGSIDLPADIRRAALYAAEAETSAYLVFQHVRFTLPGQSPARR